MYSIPSWLIVHLRSQLPIFESEGMDADEFNHDDNNNNDSVSEAEVNGENSAEEESVVAVDEEGEQQQPDTAKKTPY